MIETIWIRTVYSVQVRVNLWDLAGGNEYLEVRNECYRDAQGGLLTYDATSRGSFETLEGWIEESAKYGAGDMVRQFFFLSNHTRLERKE